MIIFYSPSTGSTYFRRYFVYTSSSQASQATQVLLIYMYTSQPTQPLLAHKNTRTFLCQNSLYLSARMLLGLCRLYSYTLMISRPVSFFPHRQFVAQEGFAGPPHQNGFWRILRLSRLFINPFGLCWSTWTSFCMHKGQSIT